MAAGGATAGQPEFAAYYSDHVLPGSGTSALGDAHARFLGPDRVVDIEWMKAAKVGSPCLEHERLQWPLRTGEVHEVPQGTDPAGLELEGRLRDAVLRQPPAEVERVVRAGAPLLTLYPLEDGSVEPERGTCLDLAVLHRRHAVALRLLQLGDEEARALAASSTRALAWAARDGCEEVVRHLVLLGDAPGQRDEKGRSGLLLAATRGQVPCVRHLLAAGALELEGGEAAEEVKGWIRHWKMKAEDGQPLLEAYGKATARDGVVAVASERQEAPALPQQPGDAEAQRLQHQLAAAIRHKGIKEAKQLVEAGAPLMDGYYLDGDLKTTGTALDLAVLSRRFRLAEALLRAVAARGGGAAEALARASPSALAAAAGDNQTELVAELLRLGADGAQIGIQGESALLRAARRGSPRCARALLEAGAWEREAARQEVREWAQRWKMGLDELLP